MSKDNIGRYQVTVFENKMYLVDTTNGHLFVWSTDADFHKEAENWIYTRTGNHKAYES